MALDGDKPFGFDEEESKNTKTVKTGLDLESRLNRKGKRNNVQDDTYTYTHTYTPNIKEKKTKRLNGWVKPSVWEKVSKYAEEHGTSFNGVIDDLLDEFIERNGL